MYNLVHNLFTEGFRVKRSISQRLTERKRQIRQRLEVANGTAKYQRAAAEAPAMLQSSSLQFELSDKNRGVAYGGAALFLRLANEVGLVEAIDRRVHLLRFQPPGKPTQPRGGRGQVRRVHRTLQAGGFSPHSTAG